MSTARPSLLALLAIALATATAAGAAGSEPLRLGAPPASASAFASASVSVSDKREGLVALLAELIESRRPLGLWTRGGGGDAARGAADGGASRGAVDDALASALLGRPLAHAPRGFARPQSIGSAALPGEDCDDAHTPSPPDLGRRDHGPGRMTTSTTTTYDFLESSRPTPVPGARDPAPPDEIVTGGVLLEEWRTQAEVSRHQPPPKPTPLPTPAPTPQLPRERERERERERVREHTPTAPPLSKVYLPQPSIELEPALRDFPPDSPRPDARRDPAPPSWSFSMTLRGELSVPLAGYAEDYTMSYDDGTGETRLDMNGGTARSLCLRAPDGSYRRMTMAHEAQADGTRVRVCREAATTSRQRPAPPALPDMEKFRFAGYETDARLGDGRMERWTREVHRSETAAEGGAGEERLTYRHEMLVARHADGPAPVRYSVSVDSSLLGADSDSYVHTYRDMRAGPPSRDLFAFDSGVECDRRETVDGDDPEQQAALEPMRQFTEETRGPLHATVLQRYKVRFTRQYVDFGEETVRKNILIQNTRFVAAVNRRGERFLLEVNFLADRLRPEIEQLFGALPVSDGSLGAPPAPFPHSQQSVRRLARRLPSKFDWREQGGVTPVGYQGKDCMSCWAWAVAGAVEGGLFRRTRRLVDLSEQCLVDCGHRTGAHGCSGTWPVHAYEYIRQHGLPAVADYGTYTAKVEACGARRASPSAYISGHVNVTSLDIAAIKVAIYRHGPVVVILDASSNYFIHYKTGVLDDPVCKSERLTEKHAVLAVGWEDVGERTHLTLKNSWSEVWGDAGYVTLDGSVNRCGVLNWPSYPLFPSPTKGDNDD